jgi:hypothetical protein
MAELLVTADLQILAEEAAQPVAPRATRKSKIPRLVRLKGLLIFANDERPVVRRVLVEDLALKDVVFHHRAADGYGAAIPAMGVQEVKFPATGETRVQGAVESVYVLKNFFMGQVETFGVSLKLKAFFP